MGEIKINLNDLVEFGENPEQNNTCISIDSSDGNIFTLNIQFDGEEEKKISVNNIEIKGLNKKIFFFPIIRSSISFKGVQTLPKYEYIFFFVYLADDNNIAIFSNNIFEYIAKVKNTDINNSILDIDNNDFEKLTSSFYLFSKEEETNIYKWKSILSFFSTFFNIALEDDDYKNLIYKIKGDSVAFFKSRYMQEKTIKTLITEKNQGESFINAMFYGNLLKNLTFRIENNLIDLNGKGKGGFNITTTTNNDKYFEKIQTILLKINNIDDDSINKLPVFFLEGDIGKDNNEELNEYNIIDMFPRVFKDDNKGNIYVLDFKNQSKLEDENYNIEVDLNIKDFFNNIGTSEPNFLDFKGNIKEKYQYQLLESSDNDEIDEKENEKDLKQSRKPITDNDLFILFSKGNSEELFLGKIKEICTKQELVIKLGKREEKIDYFENCYGVKEKIKKWLEDENYNLDFSIKNKIQDIPFKKENLCCKTCEEKNKRYYIEAYKLYTSVGKFEPINQLKINKSEENNNINFNYILNNKNENIIGNEKVFGFKYKNKNLSFLINKKNIDDDGLEYFFNGASISGEDMISLGLIAQLNNGKINIGNKKTIHGELADIIGFKKDNDKSIIHLLHIKSSPFIVNGKKDSYSYYTTAIGQMLQKIEPILMKSSENFFTVDVKIDDIKNKIGNFIKKGAKNIDLNIELGLKEELNSFSIKTNFLNKIKSSKNIELRVGVAVLKSQLEGDINNKVFFMIENILLKGFEHTIKPFLSKEVEIIFYPIIID